MTHAVASPHSVAGTSADGHHLTDLQHLIEHAAHLLPSQGPISVFVHHNTLHAFEDLPFEEAMRVGGRVYGCETYLPEERYRDEVQRGRIRSEDLAAVLADDLGPLAEQPVGSLGTHFHVRLAMLETPLRVVSDAQLRWLMTENEALTRFRSDAPRSVRERLLAETRHWVMRDLRNGSLPDATEDQLRLRTVVADLFEHFGADRIEQWSDAAWESFTLELLWRACHQGVHRVWERTPGAHAEPVRERDLLLTATGEDSDQLVHELLIRFCGAFLDQGVATWSLPDRQEGFWSAFCEQYQRPVGPPERWLHGLRGELKRIDAAGLSPLQSIDESLMLLGVPPEQREQYLIETLLALRGWAGMIWQMETNAEWLIRPAPRGTLIEFLAVRLILDRLAIEYVARKVLGFRGELSELRRIVRPQIHHGDSSSADQRAYLIFQIAQFCGWRPEDLFHLPRNDWASLVAEVGAFNSLERRRIYQLGYERRYRLDALNALSQIPAPRDVAQPQRPRFQLITCIDDREESFRRHLEELAPDCETFGVAGFFAAAMYYRGAADAHFIPLCPVVIKPQHYVQEEVAYSFSNSHQRRSRTRRWLGTSAHWFHTGSRSFLGGVATALVGSVASIPLVTRILFPRVTARIRRIFGRYVQPPPVTQLHLERLSPRPGPAPDQLGYTLPEMASVVARMLEDIGLTSGFSRLVLITGHGSSSLNNPHESAYNCGACGGGRGGPNARAFATMANDPRVRAILASRGLKLPDETWFVGAYHNTCDDGITWFDLDRLPRSHRPDFDAARAVIDAARERNAHERCRRFESAPLNLSPSAALRHVEERAEDLSQARPEYNHATNAMCFVGRRSRTRGLYLDRRCFLTSYDPTQDTEDAQVLARILGAVIPVCAGISLEYYFSTVDVAVLGCGSKLPHNIASLIGVMDGAASDLRTGLSAQMVEIHEPLRILFVIETTPAAMLSIMERSPAINQLVRNEWVQLATISPTSSRMHLFRDGEFHAETLTGPPLPVVSASADWYRGWRDHLGFALIHQADSAGPFGRTSAATERVRS